MTTELTEYDKINMTVQPWFVNLVDDCKTIVIETEFVSRWALVEGYHMLGTRILTEYENFQRIRMPDSELVQRIAISIGRRNRTVYYAIQFARMYPDLNLLKEGKNISWNRVVKKYLTSGDKTERECVHIPIVLCRLCKKNLGDEYAISQRC